MMTMRRKTFTLAGFALLAVATSGCSASTAPAEAEPAIEDACVFLAGGVYSDAVDYFIDYANDHDAVDPEKLPELIDRLELASEGASGELASALDTALVEFRAIDERFHGSDSLADVDYQSLADSLDEIGELCGG